MLEWWNDAMVGESETGNWKLGRGNGMMEWWNDGGKNSRGSLDRIHRIFQDLQDWDRIRVHLCPFVVQGFGLGSDLNFSDWAWIGFVPFVRFVVEWLLDFFSRFSRIS
jgi:hypothetical protein